MALFTATAQALPAPFDLSGPSLQVTVKRGAVTLPIAQVPDLAIGDQIWIKADLPPLQTAHYLMVAAFLSGSTNPPPEKWFFRCKTWKAGCGRDGLTVTVPAAAQQVVVFLAPETSGDFGTLMGAVRGRPGAFVRTSQDLNQAALDRSRLEHYIATIRSLNDTDPGKLAATTPLLARSLGIRVDDKCLDKIPELQAPCLMTGQEALILNDGHSTSLVEALTTGPGSDLAMEASYTPQANYGYYSPYIASVLDIARIFDSFHTAQYQYIPALASAHGDRLMLTLNAAPSFHNPKSVLVAALPAVAKPQFPPMHAVNPKEIYCASKTALVLPVEGAPLVFATGFAHDMTLTLTGKDGVAMTLPATPDAVQGGYVVVTAGLNAMNLGDEVRASLHGLWGFEGYQGPSFRLMNAHVAAWQLAPGDEQALVIGRQDTIHVRADSVSCVDGIMLKDPSGKEVKTEWKAVRADEIEIKLPLQGAAPGAMTLLVSQYGQEKTRSIPIVAFAEAGRFDAFALHAGDSQGTLRGSRLDEVASLTLKNLIFTPGELISRNGSDELPMLAQDSVAAAALKADRSIAARVTLRDGRTFPLNASIDGARPIADLIGKSVQPSVSSDGSNLRMADPNEIPQDATLVFSVRTRSPATLTREETIEVATADDSLNTTLSFGNGGLAFENSKILVATLNPLKAFGASGFGAMQYRIVSKGVAGAWQPLGNLVRLPTLREFKCSALEDQACSLSGNNLFLIDSIAGSADFAHAISVPDGFVGSSLAVPHANDGSLFVRLRDNPSVSHAVTLQAMPLPPTTIDTPRTAVAQ